MNVALTSRHRSGSSWTSPTSASRVVDVVAGSPAARAGIAPGDIVLEVNRQSVASAAEAGAELNRVPSGGFASVLVLRNGQEIFLTVTKQ